MYPAPVGACVKNSRKSTTVDIASIAVVVLLANTNSLPPIDTRLASGVKIEL